ncbi:MAG: hypothetical protein PHX22_06930, partial [Dysgonamonadaceae bacterium]|nr:hypothetical protein [Dysgonamonadaceae bacterium]
ILDGYFLFEIYFTLHHNRSIEILFKAVSHGLLLSIIRKALATWFLYALKATYCTSQESS